MKIYYYTRTGRSEKIAHDMAKQVNLHAYPITDDEKWGGAFNFIKAGAMASKKSSVNAHFEQAGQNELIIVVFPLWAASLPPTIRNFTSHFKRENMILVPTSLATKLKERDGFKAIIDLIGKEISAPDISEYK